jgi:hypothetical protein
MSIVSGNLSAWMANYCPGITLTFIFIVIFFWGIFAMTEMSHPGVQILAATGSISSSST